MLISCRYTTSEKYFPICVTRMANQRRVYSKRQRAALNLTAVTMSLADLGGREGRMPPLGVQILSISCSFRGKFGVFTPPLEGSRPPLGKILDPPLNVTVIGQTKIYARNKQTQQFMITRIFVITRERGPILLGNAACQWLGLIAMLIENKAPVVGRFRGISYRRRN